MMFSLKNKKIVIGLTGSIACYKICELIRMFTRCEAEVKVVLTESAYEFIGEKTLETLTGHPVYYDMFAKRESTGHISLADWADIFIIAPASANTISKAANGIADNLLTSTFCAYLGSKKPAIIAPAMNTGMLCNPFVENNIKKLKENNVKIVEPAEGMLACGYEGKGKMADIKDIFNECVNLCTKGETIKNKTTGKKVVITTGGTKEAIDPVRYITNASSGKTGCALADAAYNMGYNVELISTFEINGKPYNVTVASDTLSLQKTVKEKFKNADYLIMAAAVSDYRVKNPSDKKISRKDKESLTVELVKNPDILKDIGENKKEGQKVIGFSLTTENTLEIAKEKLIAKNLDFIVANEANKALNKDTTEVWVIDKKGNAKFINNTTKQDAAYKILELVL